MPPLTLAEAQARLAELDRKSRELEEDIQKDGDTKNATEDIDALS